MTDYLTKVVSSHLSWLKNDTEREGIWDLASERLAERAGRTAMGDITREFLIPKNDGNGPDSTIVLKLYEPALTGDNLGLKTWSSSFVLAKLLHTLDLPISVSSTTHDLNTHTCANDTAIDSGTRARPLIIDLGSGTGLAGLAAAALWPHCDAILTDLPEIEPNLARNVNINKALLSNNSHQRINLKDNAVLSEHDEERPRTVTSGILDWTNPAQLILRPPTEHADTSETSNHVDGSDDGNGNETLTQSIPAPAPLPTTTTTPSSNPASISPPSPKTAQLLLAADPIYSPSHPALLASAVKTWLARPHPPQLHPSLNPLPRTGRSKGTSISTGTASSNASIISTPTSPCKSASSARFILAHPYRQAYTPQISELRRLLSEEIGLVVVKEGVERVWDDWDEEVEVGWSVWGWKC